MKPLKALTLSALLGATAFSLSACTSAQKGAAGLGAAGGAAGLVVGNNMSAVGPTTGAIIGGSSGAAVGGLAGDAYDYTNEDDARRELENLREELANKEQELADLQGGAPTEEQLAEVDDLKTRIAALEGELGEAWNRVDEEAANRMEAEQQVASLTGEIDQLSAEREALQNELDTLQAQKEALQQSLENANQESDQLRQKLDEQENILGQLQDETAQKEEALTELSFKTRSLQDTESQLSQELAEKEAALDAKEQELAMRQAELNELQGQVTALRTSLDNKEVAVNELRSDLEDLNIKLEETSRGLTMTIVDELLYTAGSSELTTDGQALLGEVADILKERFPNRELLIEGHTDNQPIVHSGWRSNWELGAARALTILHELTSVHGFDPAKVSATSYGEFRPTAPNATAEGRSANRRAVIVILPEKLPVQRESLAQVD